MPVIMSKAYKAFLQAGVPEEEARKAAEEIVSLDRRLLRLQAMVAASLVVVVAILVLVVRFVAS